VHRQPAHMQHDLDGRRSTVRMLCAVLGDVTREEDSEEVFRQIEGIRQASVKFHRESSTSPAQHWRRAAASAAELKRASARKRSTCSYPFARCPR
jgi:phosphoenolpyruvate carboxylase